MVSVIVLFPKIDEAKSIRNLLVRSGIGVTTVCTTGTQVIAAVDNLECGIVVCGYKYPDMVYSDLKDYLPSTFDMLVLASKSHFTDCTGDDIVFVSMPLKPYDLINTLNLMVDNQLRKRKKRKMMPRVRDEGEKAVIENAKVMLINEKGMSEEDAHKYIQKISMDSGTNLVETAHMILELY